VLLYELLTAQTPLESKNLLSRGFDEMRRMIREFEPQIPSLRLGSQKESDSTSTARRHGTDAHKLIHLVRGDLDWVVMKCLEKDRALRYETAGSLAADVQRVLDNEPVEARPPSGLYRFRKLVRRNKLAFAASIAIWVALVVGLGVTTWFVIQEKQERDLADIASKRANSARQIAEASREQAEADRKRAEVERQQAEVSRQKAEAALQQSEADRARAVAAERKAEDSAREAQASEKKAEDSEKEAQAARQQAETALQQARAERSKADTAEKQAKDSQSLVQTALHETEAAQIRANAAAAKSEEAARNAAAEASLRRQAEASTAAALAQVGQWRGALTNLLAGLDAAPPAEALKAVNAFFTPEDLKQPWAAPFLRARGNWHARHGDSDAAIADLSQALNMEPGNPDLHHRLAPLLAENGAADAYGHDCAQFLKQCRETNNPTVAKDCLLAPARDVDLPSLAALARNAVAARSSEPHQAAGKLVLSLAEYRQGHFAEAADLAVKALSGAAELGDPAAAQADAVLAMAQQRLDHSEDARAALDKGQQILDTKMPKPESADLGGQWPDWVTARLLLHEARSLVPAQPAAK
jgi:hypothetical protein